MTRATAVLALALGSLVASAGCSAGGRASSSDRGSVLGTLVAVGGPPSVPARPLRGTVTLTPTSGGSLPVTLRAGSGGRFRVDVPAGTYTVVAHSPAYVGGRGTCTTSRPVTVALDAVTAVVVRCQEM